MTRQEEERAVRLKKLEQASQLGWIPYPAKTKRSHVVQQVLAQYNELAKTGGNVTVAGRLRTIRLHGGSCFAHLQDESGSIQCYFKRDLLGNEQYYRLRDLIDVGDFIETTGTIFTTHKGEKTILSSNYTLLAKSLLPLPEKWHGLSDIEIRYRQRYLDCIANPGISAYFRKRSQLITSVRRFLNDHGFLEVETPILQPIPGGANAKPFQTHHEALHADLYLRIAPELYLKRLIVGGFERVYEIARCFRNEGIDRDHNPEFTQVEFYVAYWDYRQLMKFTEQMFATIVERVTGGLVIEYEGKKVEFTSPFPRLSFHDACMKFAKINIDDLDDAALKREAHANGLTIESSAHRPKILDEIFKERIKPNITRPTFVTDYPIELSPLAKQRIDDQRYTERFQLVAAGMELCNAFSELNDPLEQEKRFSQQERLRKAGDHEAQQIDQDFITALAHGMPPTAGIGIGLDRLSALLCNVHNIKEVIFFPTLKPKR